MQYKPLTCVWEVTMGCNMRCGHCGSSCNEPLPDELSTEEALDLCRQIAALGLKWVTLSGGEPLTRKDLPRIVKELSEKQVSVNIITNGWMLKQDMANKLKECGAATVAVSIDGTEKIHDSIRKEGAYKHAEKAFKALKKSGINTGAVTTITKKNLDILDQIKEELIRMEVGSWQVQLGLPMGNMKEKPDWVIEPYQIKDIIDFCFETAKEGRIKIYPADCIGYYTKKELMTKRISYGNNYVSIWDGCNAGVRGFGILQNGDILGCTSIRDKEFIEGSIKERSLRDIWNDKNSFLWRRNMEKKKLSGLCKSCHYGSRCLGGCPNTRLTMNGDIYSENQYCSYHLELKHMQEKYKEETNLQGLYELALGLISSKEYQEAAYALEQVTALEPEHTQALKAKGYCEYMCGNYSACEEDNKKALAKNPWDAYAMRGYAIALYRMGQLEEGLFYMQKAVMLTEGRDHDLLLDLNSMQQNMQY